MKLNLYVIAKKAQNNFKTGIIPVWIIVMITLFNYSSFAQYSGPPEPTLTPGNSSDKGMTREIEELQNYKLNNKAASEQLEQFIQNYITTHKQEKTAALPDTTCVITIPIVFHVFHPSGSTGVPLSQIDYAVKDLNITFAGTDAAYQNVASQFAGIKSYTKIRFARALIDPKGNPTTGVVYYKDKQPGFGNGSGYDAEIASVAWDNYKYFNIYLQFDLYANNQTNNSGVCWYPDQNMSNNGTARMVYNYVYFGQGGSSYNNLEFNQTFTHEAGHYMNLAHTFDGNSCSGAGDNCNDTPPTDIAAGGCTGTRCGGVINGSNYMDYNNTCYMNFTMDQNTRMEAASQHASRATLWKYDNQVATGILDPNSTKACVMASKFFSFSKTKLDEDIANNGSIETPPVKIYACGGAQFTKMGQTLASGTDYTLTNVPAGLTAAIVTDANGKVATLTFSGNAGSHQAVNSVNNMLLTFTNAAVTGGNVSAITNYTKTLSIKFKDTWKYTCATPNKTVTSSATWQNFETAGPIPRYYGLWYNGGSYYIENYGRALITTSASSDNIAFVPAGTTIGASSTWRAGGNQGVLYSNAYTSLNNLTGYVGFRMQAGNDYYYGWMKVTVSSTSGVTLLEYQYNNKPNDPIVAGSACSTGISLAEVLDKSIMAYPNPANQEFILGNMADDYIGGVYEIYSLEGKLLEVKQITHVDTRVNSGNLSQGVYILSILNKDKSRKAYIRLCVEH